MSRPVVPSSNRRTGSFQERQWSFSSKQRITVWTSEAASFAAPSSRFDRVRCAIEAQSSSSATCPGSWTKTRTSIPFPAPNTERVTRRGQRLPGPSYNGIHGCSAGGLYADFECGPSWHSIWLLRPYTDDDPQYDRARPSLAVGPANASATGSSQSVVRTPGRAHEDARSERYHDIHAQRVRRHAETRRTGSVGSITWNRNPVEGALGTHVRRQNDSARSARSRSCIERSARGDVRSGKPP